MQPRRVRGTFGMHPGLTMVSDDSYANAAYSYTLRGAA